MLVAVRREMTVTYVHINHDGFDWKIAPNHQGGENEFEHVQSTSITLTAWCDYLCSDAQIMGGIRQLNERSHTMGGMVDCD